MLKIRCSQKVFTEDEVASLTGICVEHLRALATNHHLGFFEAAEAARAQALEAAQSAEARRVFSASDLYIVTALLPRCEH